MKRTYYSLFLLLSCGVSCIAQGEWAWAKINDNDHGSGGGAAGTSNATDRQGNVFVTGEFVNTPITFGTITLANTGCSDVFLVKYDSSGNVLWAKSMGSSECDMGYGVATDAEGNVFVTGYFGRPAITFGDIILTNPFENSEFEAQKFFLAKYDPDGNVLWAKMAHGNTYDYGAQIIIDSYGNAYVAGAFYSHQSQTITFDTISLYLQGISNIFLTKYDPNGNALWAKCVPASCPSESIGIAGDLFGNVYLSGAFTSPTLTIDSMVFQSHDQYPDGSLPQGGSDIFLTKFDSNGNVLWAKSFGGSLMDMSSGIATEVSGNVYMTGRFTSPTLTFGNTTLFNTPTPYGFTSDIFITKLDTDGNTLWAKNSIGPSEEIGMDIATDGSGSVFVTGYIDTTYRIDTLAFGNIKFTINAHSDIVVAQYDTSGNAIWVYHTGGNAWNQGRGINADLHGNILISGVSEVSTFGDFTLISIPSMFIAKLRPCDKLVASIHNSVAICFGDSITLASTSPTNNTWSTGEISPSIIVDRAGDYVATVINSNGCSLRFESFTVTVKPLPQPSITASSLIFCEGNPVTLSTNEAETYLWNTGATSPSISLSAPGNYSVTITDANGCTATAASVEIKLNASYLQLFEDCNRIFVKGDYSLTWFMNNERMNVSDPYQKEVYPVDSGFYYVEVSNFCGTKRSNTINFKPADIRFIFQPNVITPNGDGYNDIFVLDKKLSGSTLAIVNRWGNEVFYSEEYQNNWNGGELSSGTYYYIISNSCFTEKLKGILSIIR